jgi:hypothetical protein
LRKILSYLFVLVIATGCINTLKQNDSLILAKVHDNYLYISDIEYIIPENISARDSIALVRSYVKDWVQTKVIIYQAEQNLQENQLDFTKQLNDYRNSLIIYQYETSLINQNLDTIVSDAEVEEYYNSHLKDFELKENITKVAYVVIDQNPTVEAQFDYLFSLPDSLLFDSLDYYTPEYVISSFLDTTRWIGFYNIQQIIPIETYNRELFLKNNRFVKINAERYIYFVKFIDFKIKDDISPLDFKRNDIHNIIISRRKVNLAKKVRNDILERALKNKEYEIYYHE